ncbi:MAG: GtrA family protein [Pseudomonadota bacterium]
MNALAQRLGTLWQAALRGDVRWMRYVFASVMALATDAGLFLILLGTGMSAWSASAIGYSSGILVHWLVSSRIVFADGAATRGSDERTKQKALFALSALIGLAITTAIVGGGETAGLDARIAKLVAIAVSFQATYLLRARVVFRG